LSIKIIGIPQALTFLKMKDKEAISRANDAIHQAGFFVEGEVKESIRGARAEPQSVDTGRFLQSVKTQNGKLSSVVSSDVEYAKYLEYGTSRVSARHHFGNTKTRNKKKVTDLVNDSMKKL